MIQIQQTEAYAKWFSGLRDRIARARIDIRIRRLSLGNAGDAKPVGDVVIVLLAEGDKPTQDKDIRNAKALAKALKE